MFYVALFPEIKLLGILKMYMYLKLKTTIHITQSWLDLQRISYF